MRKRLTTLSWALTSLSLSLATTIGCDNNGDVSGTGGLGGTGGTSASGSGGSGGTGTPAATISDYIVVDQFGYLPDSEKIAILRDPETGFDASESYAAGASYQVVDVASKEVVLEMTPKAWASGAIDLSSGDKVWRLDFSSVETPGEYYIVDPATGARSDDFVIGTDVYKTVLKHAFRTFFYQRSGFAKTAEFAGEAWADGASHLGAGQDTDARLYNDTTNAATSHDVSGGWFDAGDYNKYTAWTAEYITTLLRMYEETPDAFGDDFGIPESGNGVSDLLDEVRFGLDHLVKLDLGSGNYISVVGVSHASPPSAALGASTYGPATTNATIRAGIALATAARVFEDVDSAFAASLLTKAEAAWDWASANPSVTFSNTNLVAAGEQQSSDTEVKQYKLGLAVALYRATGDAAYKTFFESNYDFASSGISFLNGYLAAWQLVQTEFFFDYAALPDADATIKDAIVSAYLDGLDASSNLGNLTSDLDPYLAYVADYTWGSNSHKARTGCLLHDVAVYGFDSTKAADARKAAERYVHYLHGVNPLGLVYLSNMGDFGAHKSVTTFYHSWFKDGSALWDEVGVSTYGPAPGFLVGGPNPSYDWDAKCPGHALCPTERPAPPYGQPKQKSYAQFNTNWPVNSWAVTENSNGYQVAYLRLLAKFVK